jgi:hypothetical protein
MSAVALQRPTAVPRRAPQPEARPVAETVSGHRTLLLSLAVVAVIAVGVFGAVALNALAADAAVQARALEREVAVSEQTYAERIVAVAAKEDPARIRARALELGLVPSVAARHLVLERPIDADGVWNRPSERSLVPDPLKPVLTQDR